MKRDRDIEQYVNETYWPLVEFAGGKTINAIRTIGNRIRRIEKNWKINLMIKYWRMEIPFDAYLKKLPVRKLKLFRKPTKVLPFFLCKLPQLESINVNKCQLKEVPDYWDKLTNLKVLVLTNNLLTSLPKSFSTLRQLNRLSLSGNRYAEVPEAISGLSQITSLSLGSGKEISFIPEWIGSFKNLNYLSFSHTKISYLPKSFGNLTKLNCLYIFRTPLVEKHKILTDDSSKADKVQEYIKKVLNIQNNKS
jgi:hypothetical protein